MEIVAIDLDREYFAKHGNFFPVTGKSSISESHFCFCLRKASCWGKGSSIYQSVSRFATRIVA